jgi:membrane associated rhomboid family serine protease
VIPYSDPSEPGHIFPTVNLALIVANFMVFFYELSLGTTGMHGLNTFISQYGVVPCEYTGHLPCKLSAEEPSPLAITLFSSMFIHQGLLHILGNMLFLFVFGDNIENSMGHLRYLVFYLLCGLGASALEILTAVGSDTPGIGASGAIAGVLGAYLALYPGSRVGTIIPIGFIPLPLRLPAFVLIGFWFVEQAFNGVVSLETRAVDAGGVAYFAHVGGFVTGILLIWLFRHPRHVDRMRTYHARELWR